MNPTDVQTYLHEHIPLSAAMWDGGQVLVCDLAGATLAAPLEPNINHRATVFGGSASAVEILAAWTWLNFALRDAGRPSRLVIQRNPVDHVAPVTGEFEARCEAVSAVAFDKFLRLLARHGKGRIELGAVLTLDGATVATCRGDCVAVKAAS